MEFGHRMMRAAIGAIVEKSIYDIRKDTKRSARALVDMGEYFAKGGAQKNFFSMAHDVLREPKNPYNELLYNLANNVDERKIKTVGLNMGYSAFTYGVNIIRKQEKILKHNIPWMISFDFSSGGFEEEAFSRLDSLIEQGCELGIFVYIFNAKGSAESLGIIGELAKKYYECTFFAAISTMCITEDLALGYEKIPNIVLSIEIESNFNYGQEYDRAFEILSGRRLFYGFHLFYSVENVDKFISHMFIDKMIEKGCIFGEYVSRDRDDTNAEKKLYEFICNTRGRSGKPLLVFDWQEDFKYISSIISGEAGILVVYPNGQVIAEGLQERVNVFDTSLRSVLERTMPEIL